MDVILRWPFSKNLPAGDASEMKTMAAQRAAQPNATPLACSCATAPASRLCARVRLGTCAAGEQLCLLTVKAQLGDQRSVSQLRGYFAQYCTAKTVQEELQGAPSAALVAFKFPGAPARCTQ